MRLQIGALMFMPDSTGHLHLLGSARGCKPRGHTVQLAALVMPLGNQSLGFIITLLCGVGQRLRGISIHHDLARDIPHVEAG